jgi:hypothetical protein
MRKKKKFIKQWKWISQTDKPDSAPVKASVSYPEDAQESGTLIPVINKSYEDETLIIDGRNFINCEFRKCTIHWNGNDFIFTTCIFHGAQKFVSPLPQVAGAMRLAKICGLLGENTSS